jgi:hypothetical protein
MGVTQGQNLAPVPEPGHSGIEHGTLMPEVVPGAAKAAYGDSR